MILIGKINDNCDFEGKNGLGNTKDLTKNGLQNLFDANKVALPIDNYEIEICESIENNTVTIISAQTGSGKSTQIGQFLDKLGYKSIITQPRKFPASSIANYVAMQMGKLYGDYVGCSTSENSDYNKNTRILFCTEGTLVMRETNYKSIFDSDEKVALVLDEIHEWTLDMEILVGLMKKRIKEGKPTKLVLMSATLNQEELLNYFSDLDFDNKKVLVNAINISGRNYEVQKFYEGNKNIFELIRENAGKNNILVFLPGEGEIHKIISQLNEVLGNDIIILPLYSRLSNEEKNKVYKDYGKGKKIVISTNIAQTSITIPDIDMVIDSGTEKTVALIGKCERLKFNPISRASCEQRAGRAGRCKDGKYILVSDYSLNSLFRTDYDIPEIQRLNLESLVLRIAKIGIQVDQIDFFHQPDVNLIKRAKESLKFLGLLDENGKITDLGMKVVDLPISPNIACIIDEASKRNCLTSIIPIVACLQSNGIVNTRNFKNFKGKQVPLIVPKLLNYDSDFVYYYTLFYYAKNKKKIVINDKIVENSFDNNDIFGIGKKIFDSIKILGFENLKEEELLQIISQKSFSIYSLNNLLNCFVESDVIILDDGKIESDVFINKILFEKGLEIVGKYGLNSIDAVVELEAYGIVPHDYKNAYYVYELLLDSIYKSDFYMPDSLNDNENKEDIIKSILRGFLDKIYYSNSNKCVGIFSDTRLLDKGSYVNSNGLIIGQPVEFEIEKQGKYGAKYTTVITLLKIASKIDYNWIKEINSEIVNLEIKYQFNEELLYCKKLVQLSIMGHNIDIEEEIGNDDNVKTFLFSSIINNQNGFGYYKNNFTILQILEIVNAMIKKWKKIYNLAKLEIPFEEVILNYYINKFKGISFASIDDLEELVNAGDINIIDFEFDLNDLVGEIQANKILAQTPLYLSVDGVIFELNHYEDCSYLMISDKEISKFTNNTINKIYDELKKLNEEGKNIIIQFNNNSGRLQQMIDLLQNKYNQYQLDKINKNYSLSIYRFDSKIEKLPEIKYLNEDNKTQIFPYYKILFYNQYIIQWSLDDGFTQDQNNVFFSVIGDYINNKDIQKKELFEIKSYIEGFLNVYIVGGEIRERIDYSLMLAKEKELKDDYAGAIFCYMIINDILKNDYFFERKFKPIEQLSENELLQEIEQIEFEIMNIQTNYPGLKSLGEKYYDLNNQLQKIEKKIEELKKEYTDKSNIIRKTLQEKKKQIKKDFEIIKKQIGNNLKIYDYLIKVELRFLEIDSLMS